MRSDVRSLAPEHIPSEATTPSMTTNLSSMAPHATPEASIGQGHWPFSVETVTTARFVLDPRLFV
jgi:hypothetical protein